MRITLIGYGKMGKEIEKIALERGHLISGKISLENYNDLESCLANSDVAIEFTQPESAVKNIYKCFSNNTPVIVGTTGWGKQEKEVFEKCSAENQTLFYASNFSVGVNIFFEINKQLATLMNDFEDYEVAIEEIHHIHKKDAPSGTAISLAQVVLNQLKRKNQWKLDQTGSDLINISAKRIDEVPGTHTISYENEIDEITFSHKAKNRKGFALGAALAAEFSQNKKGIYTMKDLLNL